MSEQEQATERDPLIQNAILQTSLQGGAAAPPPNAKTEPSSRRPGPREISRATRYGLLAGVWIATFLSSLNTTLVATLLPTISSEFRRSHQASWLGTAYLLATCTFTPLYGRLCTVMGRRGANQTAVFFAALGTLMCGLSGSMETLIAARFLGGLGGGGAYTTSSIIISDMYSMRSRGLTQGIASVFSSLGMGLGGPIGGLISDWLGWRWAFLLQVPLFGVSFVLTSLNLHYVTPGKGGSAFDILKRIDYAGSATLLGSVGACLLFLSFHYSEGLPWSQTSVIVTFVLAIVFFFAFVLVELYVAREPVLAPFLLKQKIPVLTGLSNFFVANCNFGVIYFFPMWFQTVMLSNASTAGLHLLPNSISSSLGSVFAGWIMHKTGKYKMINFVFGILPFIGTVLLSAMRENSPPAQLWLSIIPFGLGNAVVLQTMLIALLAHVPRDAMAVATGYGQLFRGIGQVSGVAVSSAIFQSVLDRELKKRIHGPDAAKMIEKIRSEARLVPQLPPDLQRAARDSYGLGLRAVFITAACSTLCAYIVRIPVPDKILEDHKPDETVDESRESSGASTPQSVEHAERGVDDDVERQDGVPSTDVVRPPARAKGHRRRLSTYSDTDGGPGIDYESGGSARR